MEKMQKIDALPQILVETNPPFETIKSALHNVFNIREANVYINNIPDDVDWDRILDDGYAIINKFDEGGIKSRIDLFAKADFFPI